MSSGCGDVLNLADLQTAKKHQLFEAEVITGKQGGVAGGADIDYATNQVTGQVQKTMPAILRDIGFEPAAFDFTTGGTLTVNDRNKAVLWPASSGGDGNYYTWLGALPKVIPAASTPSSTGGVGPGAWKNVTDHVLRSDLALPDGAKLIGEASNIASLRGIEPTFDGQKIFLKEHTSGSRKGGGEFRAIVAGGALTDNNGTIIKTTAGAAWVRQFADSVTPFMFGAKGDWNPDTQTGTDDSAAFQASVNAWGSVYVPPGNYLIRGVDLPSNTTIYGAGASSVLWQIEGVDSNVIQLGTNFNDGGSSDLATNKTNIAIRTLKLARKNRITYASAGDAQQQYHFISIQATTGIKVQNCILEGFNGDGIYVGGGRGASIERHNLDVEISNNFFNGIDNQNRNGISVIDCEGLLVQGNVFRRVSNQYQPGAIDIEPNANTFHRLRDHKIVNNRFVQCGGGAGSAGLIIQIPDVAYTTSPSGFLFAFNEVDGVTSNAAGLVLTHNGAASPSRNHNVRVIGNKISRVTRSFSVMGFSNVLIDDNQFDGSTLGALIGFSTADRKCYNIKLSNNYFNATGTTEGRGIGIYTVDGLDVVSNRFVNVGKSDGSLGQALLFNTGTSTNVRHINNTYENLGNTTIPVAQAGHTFTPTSGINRGNSYLNCSGNVIQAAQNDEAEQSYTPILYGNTTAGTGVYTTQLGRWTQNGKWVTFRAELTTTSHDGSGIVTVSLPTLADTAVAIETVVTAQAVGAGVTAQGIAVGRIYNVVGGGVAGCRLNAATANAAVQFAAGGVMTVRVSGTYRLP